ncbi:MAG: response regulator [Pseudomonadota bacterium]
MARILIAEHNETTSGYLAATLKKAGNSVETAGSGLEAWKISSRECFDILLIDVIMPGIDGFVLAQKILRDNPALRIVFITGFAGIALETGPTSAYATATLASRSFHLNEINSCVRYLMGRGGLPMRRLPENAADNVVYADFSSKEAVARHQISS